MMKKQAEPWGAELTMEDVEFVNVTEFFSLIVCKMQWVVGHLRYNIHTGQHLLLSSITICFFILDQIIEIQT